MCPSPRGKRWSNHATVQPESDSLKLNSRTLIVAALLCGLWDNCLDAKPNVLFIALDDLNDWVGCLGGHPQTKTPNIDRLAKTGVLFANAHCPAPACSPSRAAIFTGVPPYRSGLYSNRQKLRDVLPRAELLPHQ